MREDILSVGIDIGTSTTQLIFSRITIENTASMSSIPRIKIVDKQVIYRSGIHFTPLISETEIDGQTVRVIIEAEYRKANIKPQEVRTGAVIITGETARKENAREVLKTLSGLAGDFVVATAGPDLEGIIAGKGANAAKVSKDKNCVAANLDIGGGTTNIAVFKNGEVMDTACLDIGGRLIKFKENSLEVTYVSSKMKRLAESIGIDVAVGKVMAGEQVIRITDRMAQILEEVLGIREASKELAFMLTDHGLRRDYVIDLISFSGGVADCMDTWKEKDLYKFGDIGILLGQSIDKAQLLKKMNFMKPTETIGATVVGAGSHTTEISGSTITFTEKVLPLKNIPIVKLSPGDEQLPFDKLSHKIREKVKWFNLEDGEQQVALALKGIKNASFETIQKLSKAIIDGMEDILKLNVPLVIVVEQDMAKVLGQSLNVHLDFKKDVVCIDTVKVENGDYIDIGNSLAKGKVVPVVVKTLLFGY